ncbi:MAG: response regulator, partial [Spirochaetota bacterium]|nr:response regulator [Spirochaetota bacterium]
MTISNRLVGIKQMTDNKKQVNVLLIEDKKQDQKDFLDMVEEYKLNYNCDIASSVAEVKGILSWKNQFDIIIVEDVLIDGTAFDVINLIKSVSSENENPIIFITDNGNEKRIARAKDIGAYDYLVKDQDYLTLLPITIENAIEHYRVKKKLWDTESQLDHFNTHFHAVLKKQTLEIKNHNKKLLDMNQFLVELNSRLDQALFFKERFLESMAHDLREPFNGIIPLLDMVINGFYGDISLKIVDKLSQVRENTVGLLTQVEDKLN